MHMQSLIGRCCDLKKCLENDFHFAYLGTEIFLRELTLYKTLSSNPKSSRPVDLQFFHKLHAILSSLIYDKFFHCSTTWMDEDTRLHN